MRASSWQRLSTESRPCPNHVGTCLSLPCTLSLTGLAFRPACYYYYVVVEAEECRGILVILIARSSQLRVGVFRILPCGACIASLTIIVINHSLSALDHPSWPAMPLRDTDANLNAIVPQPRPYHICVNKESMSDRQRHLKPSSQQITTPSLLSDPRLVAVAPYNPTSLPATCHALRTLFQARPQRPSTVNTWSISQGLRVLTSVST